MPCARHAYEGMDAFVWDLLYYLFLLSRGRPLRCTCA